MILKSAKQINFHFHCTGWKHKTDCSPSLANGTPQIIHAATATHAHTRRIKRFACDGSTWGRCELISTKSQRLLGAWNVAKSPTICLKLGKPNRGHHQKHARHKMADEGMTTNDNTATSINLPQQELYAQRMKEKIDCVKAVSNYKTVPGRFAPLKCEANIEADVALQHAQHYVIVIHTEGDVIAPDLLMHWGWISTRPSTSCYRCHGLQRQWRHIRD